MGAVVDLFCQVTISSQFAMVALFRWKVKVSTTIWEIFRYKKLLLFHVKKPPRNFWHKMIFHMLLSTVDDNMVTEACEDITVTVLMFNRFHKV